MRAKRLFRLTAIVASLHSWSAFGQQLYNPPVRWQGSTTAPASGNCDAAVEIGGVYQQTGNPASVRTQNFSCQQTGASSWAWMPLYGKVQTAAPATCSIGDLWFDSDATAGSNMNLCTSANTWTNVSGGGGMGSPGGSNAQLQYNDAGSFGGIVGATTNGTVVTLTSPVFITPAMGTPASGVLTNATGLPEGGLSLTDITTNNASTSKHGFLLKLDNNSAHFMNGQGAWATPAGIPAGSAITDAQCWASSTTFGVCANIILSGGITTGTAADGCAGGTAGCSGFGQGTAPSGSMTTGIQEYAPTSVTAYNRVKPGTVGTAGFVRIAVASTTATESFGPLVAADIPAVALTAGTSITLSNTARLFECTSTCTITAPVPSAGVQYCVRNANNVSTVITFAAIGSSARYENTASTAYGTAGTGTLVSGGAVGDKICIVGLDSTHYDVFSFAGTWTAN